MPLLLASRSPFDATPATVHFLPHHHLELARHADVVVEVHDIDDLHHRLNHSDRHIPTEAS